jgi:hypothetical protein
MNPQQKFLAVGAVLLALPFIARSTPVVRVLLLILLLATAYFAVRHRQP